MLDKETTDSSHFERISTPKLTSEGHAQYAISAGTAGALSIDAPKITLEWTALSLTVDVKNSQTKVLEKKTILSDVSGVARPGELLVIMGPSGAGKSSLLDCISARNRDVDGIITVNGEPWSENVKRFASYVVQDDLFYATITVREHLMFQAKLRLGGSFTKQQYGARVDAVMEELGLMKCRDTLIGGGMERGISGGERKRLSFATEILTNPSILFVDEPTSGLDSFMAEAVVTQLQQIARDGRTVIATIHQPSSELFALFDQLYLLSDGATVYHGKGCDAVPYFASLGYACPPFLNPSDYFMRQLVVLDKATDAAGVARIEGLKDAWRQRRRDGAAAGAADRDCNTDTSAVALAQPLMTYRRKPEPQNADANANVAIISSAYEDPRVGFVGQLAVLSHRNVLRMVRDDLAFKSEAAQALVIYVFVSLIYWQLRETQRGIQSFTGAFFYIAIDQMFAASYPVFATVPIELPLVSREYRAGLYHVRAWYVAKNVSELPQQVVLPLLGFVPAYFMIGIGHGVRVFAQMQLVVILLHSTSVGIGYWVSCMCRRVEIAPIVGTILMLPFLLFGGLLVNTEDVPPALAWLAYVSPVKYSFAAFMKIFWTDVPTLPCDSDASAASTATDAICLARSGADVLRNYALDTHGSGAGRDMLALLALNIAFRVLGYLALVVNLKRDK